MSASRRRVRAALAALLAASLLALVARPADAQHRRLMGADSVRVTAHAAAIGNPVGEAILIHVVLDHAEGFHTWPNEPVVPEELRGLTPIATRIEVVELPVGASVERIDWPVPEPVRVSFIDEPLEVLSFAGQDTATVIVRTGAESAQAEGDRKAGVLRFEVEYQACDNEICYPPKTVELEVPEPRR